MSKFTDYYTNCNTGWEPYRGEKVVGARMVLGRYYLITEDDEGNKTKREVTKTEYQVRHGRYARNPFFFMTTEDTADEIANNETLAKIDKVRQARYWIELVVMLLVIVIVFGAVAFIFINYG